MKLRKERLISLPHLLSQHGGNILHYQFILKYKIVCKYIFLNTYTGPRGKSDNIAQKKKTFLEGFCRSSTGIHGMKLCHDILYTVFVLLVAFWICIIRVAAAKILFGADFEPSHPSDRTYPMAVVLYDEANLTPFQKEVREFQFSGIKVSIRQNWKEVGVAAVVWDAVSLLRSIQNRLRFSEELQEVEKHDT